MPNPTTVERGRVLDPADARAQLERAIAQTQLSARAFALALLVDERTVRRWLSGERDIPGPVYQLCRLLTSDPQLVLLLGTPT